jgi:curli biogenesis system outer membrane secretion channel CsgG
MNTRVLAIVTALTTTLVSGAVAQTSKPRLAVKTFDNPTTSANSTIGDAVTDIFFTEVGRPGLFRLVERSAFEEIEKEVGADARRGRATADFILLGKVTNFSFDEQSFEQQRATTRGQVTETMYRQNARVRVDFRVVSTATGVAVITESGEATESKVSATAEMETYRRLLRVGVFSSEAQDSMIGRATIGAIRNAVRKITDLSRELANEMTSAAAPGAPAAPPPRGESPGGLSGHIFAEAGGAFIVDIGADQGLARGDRLTVFGKEVTRNKQGAVVYEEEVVVGTLEVTDVSMRSRAKAQLAPGSLRNTRGPKEGDVVRIEGSPARIDRAPAVAPTAPPPASSSDVQRLMRQGDRYVEDKYFAQAVDSYQKALALEPDSPPIIGKLVGALLYNKQMIDAEEMLDRLFAVNGSVSVGVVHNHTFGMCTGDLTITSRGIRYTPQRGDHGFVADARQIIGFDEGHVGNSTNILPALTIRFRDAQGKDRKFDFLVPAYLSARPITPLASPYDVYFGNDEALADTARVHRILIRLIEDKLGRR